MLPRFVIELLTRAHHIILKVAVLILEHVLVRSLGVLWSELTQTSAGLHDDALNVDHVYLGRRLGN